MIGDLLVLVIFIVFLGGGFLAFHLVKKNREIYLNRKEAELDYIVVTDLRKVPELEHALQAELVTGCVAVANNYFLTFCASFKNLFGGEMKGYSQLCTDARRIALVRLKEEAAKHGATVICCLRYETMVIQQAQQNKSAGVELMAYGTALIMPGSRKEKLNSLLV